MGTSLVVAIVGDESFRLDALYGYDREGNRVRLATLYPINEWQQLRNWTGRKELFRRHPDAHYLIPIRRADVWEPPTEPRERLGFNWYKRAAGRRLHAKAVQRSAEEFLNERLSRMYHMLRTGWWVLGKLKVRVVQCRPVPEREMRASALVGKPKK